MANNKTASETTKANKTTKGVYNINAMRSALIIAHKNNNKHAITKSDCDAAEVKSQYFLKWQSDCQALRLTVFDYVQKKHNMAIDSTITVDMVQAARDRIYPKYKTILEAGEEEKTIRKLHVNEFDVDSLIGYCETFMATSKGTQIASATDTLFRKKVESLLGCKIAKNAVLTDEDRDTLDAYYKAQKSVSHCNDLLAELNTRIKSLNLVVTEQTSEDLKDYINIQVKALEEEKTKVTNTKTTAEADVANYATSAKAVETKLKYAK